MLFNLFLELIHEKLKHALFLRLVDLAEWTYDWLLQLSDYRCLIKANCLITQSNHNFKEYMISTKCSSKCTNHI